MSREKLITSYPESQEKSVAICGSHECFAREGLTPDSVRRIRQAAALYAWDIYHLTHYAKMIPNGGTYLEIGSLWGGSLLCTYLATNISGALVNFIAIDPALASPSPQQKRFQNTTAGIPRLKAIALRSDEAKEQIKDGSVDLFFLDGDHHYEQVRRDIYNYWPKLKMGGIFLGHDYSDYHSWWGVIDAANEIFGDTIVKLQGNSSMFFVKKIDELQRKGGDSQGTI